MANNKATPLILATGVAIGALAGWWLLGRKPAQAGEQLTLQILDPPEGFFFNSGGRIDFTARATVDGRNISDLIRWSITKPIDFAGFWAQGATTFIIPTFMTTQTLEMEAAISDPVTGQSASARRAVVVVVSQFPARVPAIARVVASYRRSDTGWQVPDRHEIEQPWILARR